MTWPKTLLGRRGRPLLGAGVLAAVVSAALGWAASDSDPAGRSGSAADLPPIPPGFTATLELGMASGPGDAATMAETAPFGFRYQYLAGGLQDGGWQAWDADGRFVERYVAESGAHGITPVFSYYMLVQTASIEGDEPDRMRSVLADPAVMRTYYDDLAAFFDQASTGGGDVVLHLEPDLWGFMQRDAGDPSGTYVAVDASGNAELAGLPDDLAGFAEAVVRLRDAPAPDVVLAYHLSNWATGDDFTYSDPPRPAVLRIARESAAFYEALGSPFDVVFAEFSDRDAAFKDGRSGGPSWWDASDFERHATFLGRFVSLTGQRVVLWQIPYGNSRLRSVDNTWNHFQDNRVEWLLDEADGWAHLRAYADAGVVALQFGRGAVGATDASDASGDGVTNPEPVNGNDRVAVSADDDGGYFRERAAAYYEAGPLPLP